MQKPKKIALVALVAIAIMVLANIAEHYYELNKSNSKVTALAICNHEIVKLKRKSSSNLKNHAWMSKVTA